MHPASVQRLASFQYRAQQYVVVAQEHAQLEVYDEQYRLVASKSLSPGGTCIAMYQFSNQFFVYLCNGLCFNFTTEQMVTQSECIPKISRKFDVLVNAGFVRTLPNHDSPWSIVTGGKDKHIVLSETNTNSTIWKSKQVRLPQSSPLHDYLYKEPFWVQDVLISSDQFDGYNIIAATRSGKLLFYNTSQSRYPLNECAVGEYPIKSVHRLGELVVTTDSFNNVVLFDLRSMQVYNRFSVETGALATVQCVECAGRRTSRAPHLPSFLLVVSSSISNCLSVYSVQQGYHRLVARQKLPGLATMLVLDAFRDSDTATPTKKVCTGPSIS